MVKLGIIGGTGAKEVIEALGLESEVETRRVYWENSTIGNVDHYHFTQGDAEVYFILRHGKHHSDLPAKLDQRAMFNFLKTRDVEGVVLTSATGSLDTDIKLVKDGGMVINSDVMRGFGFKTISFNNPERPHANLAEPFSPRMRKLLLDSADAVVGATAYDGGIYVQNEGNQFETKAEVADLYCRLDAPAAHLRGLIRERDGSNNPVKEIECYRVLAKNLNVKHAQVGMNAVRSVVLAREAGFDELALVSFPVNYGVGLVEGEEVDHERTMREIKQATADYIVPFLHKVIENAPEYLGRN